MDGLLEWLLDALAGLVHHPAVVHATEAVLLGDAVGEVDAPVGAETFDEAEGSGPVAVEDEVLAEQPDGFRGAVVEFGGGGDRVPVAAHQLAHRRSGADLRQLLVLLYAQHGPGLLRARSLAGLYRMAQGRLAQKSGNW